MEKIARRASLSVIYEGADISADIADMVKSFSFTDNAHGQADDLEITVHDRDSLWIADWFPDQGAELRANIVCHNFLERGQEVEIPCGTFVIDELDVTGPPGEMTIRGVSSTVKSSLRREEKSRSWEEADLETIAGDISGEHGLGLDYEAPGISYDRVDQRKESDLSLLKRLSEDAGLKIKVAERKIIIFDAKEFDAKEATISYSKKDLVSWQMATRAHDVFKACKVQYWDPAGKELYTFVFEPPHAPDVGQVLKINKRVDSEAKAEELARAEIRRRNESQTTGDLEIVGDPRLYAGNNLALDDFGALSGTYFIQQVRHRYSRGSGLETAVQIRRTLEY